MTEEVQETLAEVTPAPASEVTATPAPVEIAPEVADEQKEPRVFTQEELDAVVSKRLAREQRKWDRVQVQRGTRCGVRESEWISDHANGKIQFKFL